MKTLQIVGIGGGTGLPVLLSGLAHEPRVRLSAIVTVADDGGSSGKLRAGLGLPAVGDLRNCLVALSGNHSALADLFQHRFAGGDGLEGHALGNLIVAALYQRTGSLKQAIEIASEFLPLRGKALPATEALTTLCAAFEDGSVIRGESHIAATCKQIRRVWLEPPDPPATRGVLEALTGADAIVLAPGSLYTSLLPNLLVSGVAEAIRKSPASKILVCNLLTQPGETDGFLASDHLRVVQGCLGREAIDYCIVNSAIERARGWKERQAGWEPVVCDSGRILALGAIPIEADLLGSRGLRPHHDATRLGRVVATIAKSRIRQRQAAVSAAAPTYNRATTSRGAAPLCSTQSAIA
jgi:uncharacterized cofD-like protein